jgi:hypothetical protein
MRMYVMCVQRGEPLRYPSMKRSGRNIAARGTERMSRGKACRVRVCVARTWGGWDCGDIGDFLVRAKDFSPLYLRQMTSKKEKKVFFEILIK